MSDVIVADTVRGEVRGGINIIRQNIYSKVPLAALEDVNEGHLIRSNGRIVWIIRKRTSPIIEFFLKKFGHISFEIIEAETS